MIDTPPRHCTPLDQTAPPEFPPAWAVAWGSDVYGLWADWAVAGVVQRLRWIPPGEFWMGSPEDEPERHDNEGPRHQVILTQGYWLADTACTQGLWQAVMGNNPSYFKDDPELPVESVSWNDIQHFLEKLTALTGQHADLPSEAQWEYACRAHTLPVKSFRPNPWGLWQMHGNVWEWCRDGRRNFEDTHAVDPEETSREDRELRGGSWSGHGERLRAGTRIAYPPGYHAHSYGFRFFITSQSPRSGR